jgi:transposase
MDKGITWVGLDVHKKSIQVAVLQDGDREARVWQMETSERSVRRLARSLRKGTSGEIRCCYEAGPAGFSVQRWLEAAKTQIICEVVAPSLIPVKPGERIKTDRRDAVKLAKLLRSDSLTAVDTPNPAREAVRDLCRCREDANHDLLRARHRLNKFLLRRGLIWHATSAWTQQHWAWLRSLHFEHQADRLVFADYTQTIELAQERVSRLTQALEQAATQQPYLTPVAWLRCFRGINTITALTVVAEIGRVERFADARHLMSFVGLNPTVHASGDTVHRGAISKAGNSHVRRVLIEAAWCQRHPAHVSYELRKRRRGQPEAVIALADRALRRLHHRYWHLLNLNKPHGKVVTAVARELAGFLWAVLWKVPQQQPVA